MGVLRILITGAIVCVSLVLGCLVTNRNQSSVSADVEYKRDLYLYEDVVPIRAYREISSNICECDMSLVSDIVLAMSDAGFIVEELREQDGALDVFLCKNEEKYRLHYEETGILTVIALDYEKSSVPFSYINEKWIKHSN